MKVTNHGPERKKAAYRYVTCGQETTMPVLFVLQLSHCDCTTIHFCFVVHVSSEIIMFLYCASNIADGMTEAGFPLCSFLSDRGFQIGRNARMLACHSPPRTASSKTVSMILLMEDDV